MRLMNLDKNKKIKNRGFSTSAIHIGEEPNFETSGDVVIPIHLSTTFARKEVDKPTGRYEYSRTANPTRDALEKKLAALENAKFALAFSSGLAAEASILLALLQSGDHVIAFDDLYGGTKRLFNSVFQKFGINFDFVDARDTNNVRKAIKPKTKLIWLETPTNPLLKLCDIREISEVAKEKDILVVVDNTFASPFFQKPLDLGADIVVHSTTKYIAGHSDVVGGTVMVSNDELFEKLKFIQNAVGAIQSPFDSYLVIRGIKTLAIRMRTHEENAKAVAYFLENHPKVKRVIYPGLESHPQHELAKKQMSGFGGIVTFEIKGGLPAAKKFLERLNIFLLAESLGGVESLAEHPATMTHASIPKEELDKIGITEGLIRLSVGIEDKNDLINDLEQALAF